MGTVEQDLRRYQQQIDEEDELDAATEEELTDPLAQRDFVDELDAEQLFEYMKTVMFAGDESTMQDAITKFFDEEYYDFCRKRVEDRDQRDGRW